MAVLVTDGSLRSTLAVVRALGQAGIPVVVGDSESSCLAGSSRYCTRTLRYPSPSEKGGDFLAFLESELRTGQYDLLVPMSDLTMQLIASARGSFRSIVQMPFPGDPQVSQVQDKRHILLLAREIGIPCPVTYFPDESRGLEAIAKEISYPAVIKPRFSRYCRDGEWVSGSVRYAKSGAELVAEYLRIHQRIPCPLVQEMIEGEGRGVFLLIWNGELKAAFSHRRLREKPPWGGVSVYSQSLPLDQSMVEKSFALLKTLGWQGVAMVEYKLDKHDGQAKLMEVNGRFWGSLQLAIDSGMNFPLLLHRLAKGEEVAPQFDYKAGIKSRWLLGDLDHLLISLTHRRTPFGSKETIGSRIRACADFLKFYEKELRYEVWRSEDRGPGWFELKAYVRDLFRLSKAKREVHPAR